MITQKFENTNLSKKARITEYCKQHKRLIITESIGLIFCLAMSFIFHFAYEWLGKPAGLAFLFATNESVWEHSKIIFYPYLIFGIVEYFVLKPDLKTYFTAKCLPLVLCIPIMLIIFYTYSGIIGKNYVGVDITLTIAIIIFMFATSFKMISNNSYTKHFIWLAITTAIILLLLIIFTYYQPPISLFYDHLKGAYGI